MKKTTQSRYFSKNPQTLDNPMSRRRFLGKASSVLALLGLGALVPQAGFAQTAVENETAETVTALWDESFELAIDFNIIAPSSRRYKKPYVAVWIENSEGEIVKTLTLWLMQGSKGSRWYPDLKRWYRREQSRKELYGGDMVAFMSTPTRSAGNYSLVWNGQNDVEASVVQGEYFVCIETAREHGPYQLVRELVTIGDTAFTIAVEDKTELGGVSFDYRKLSIPEQDS